MQSVRLKISKKGLLKYISHLDFNRSLTRAVRRANIPIWYTEGFNPHPYLNFLLPLPLGQTSDGEFVDIKLENEMPFNEIKERMNNVFPEGYIVEAVSVPINSADKIAMAEYEIKLTFINESDAKVFAEKASELIKSGEIIAEKTAKKGKHKIIKYINICELIYNSEINYCMDCVNISTDLAAGNSKNLNPALLIDTLSNLCNIEIRETEINRKMLILSDFSEFL